MSTKLKTREQFIEEAKKVQGDKYDYSKVEYVNNVTKVCIICPKHGEFWQLPKQHLRGQGCPKCGLERIAEKRRGKKINHKPRIKREHVKYHSVPRNIKTTEQFIEQAKKIHGDKYDYSKAEYKGKNNFVTIICPIHGEFEQRAYAHLRGGGCMKCARELSHKKQRYTNEEFIARLKEIYGDKYDYSKVDYKGNKTKITLICPEHGEFYKKASDLLNKKTGCPLCNQEHKRKYFALGKDEFVKRCTELFNGKYTYDNVKYVNNATKVLITCPKHGDFLCTPANHLLGRGCPICKAENNVYEERIYNILKTIFDEQDIERQYSADWIKHGKTIDFFIAKYNLAIEHQGSQHFKPVGLFGGEEKYKRTIELDKEKFNECKENGVELLYFAYEANTVPTVYLSEVYTDENKFKEKILNHIKNGKNSRN